MKINRFPFLPSFPLPFIHSCLQSFQYMPPIDWIILITGLLYVILAARENISCWIWGIISCSLWAYSSFVNYQLYADGILQVFYVAMGIWGYYTWKYGGVRKSELKISKWPYKKHIIFILTGIIFGLLFGYFFDEYTPAAATYLDSVTTIFAIGATFMQVRKLLENWIYWIFINAAYIYLYTSREAYLFSVIMTIYLFIAIYAYFEWKKKMSLKAS